MPVKAVLKNVKKLEIKTKHLVDGLLQGAYHSIFHGRGIEFSEVREYVMGDDIRTIDWNVTARMNQPFVKEFIEERDLTVYVVFDFSASGNFGSKKRKRDAAVELSASIMFAAMRNNDRVGLCLFTDKVEKYIPPRKGRKHVLQMIRELIYYEPKSRNTNLSSTLSYLSKAIKRRSIVFVISDFFCEGFQKPLKMLRSRNDVILINLGDTREHEIPDIGFIELEDEETGEQILLDTSDEEFKKNYSALVEERNTKLKNTLKKVKVDMVNIRSDESFDIPLRRFFKQREKRMVR